MINKFILLLSLLFSVTLSGQTKSVLFIGNSYTGANNLPQLTRDVALSVGDTLIFDAHTPGGAQIQQHSNSTAAIQKIFSKSWDHVVLQAQSQEPSFSQNQVQQTVYPYAKKLCDTIIANDSCTRPIFYQTWGRKNGDANNCPIAPWLCTYEGMDSALAFSYNKMANDNNAFLSPVGAVWKYIRGHFPNLDLYAPDESHPSMAGSYAAACTFYTVLFKKDPTLITHNAGLSTNDAQNIRATTKLVVYDSLLKWNVGKFKPKACFTYRINGCTVDFDASCSLNSTSYLWDSDDGISPTINGLTISHTYAKAGGYDVKLTVSHCGQSDDTTITIFPCTIGLTESLLDSQNLLYPNPAHDKLNCENIKDLKVEQIKLTDVHGQVVLKFKTEISDKLDISSLPKGTYCAQFITKTGEIYTEKFIKE